MLLGIAACAVRAPDIGKAGALTAVNRHMASVEEIDPAKYNATVTEEPGKDAKRYTTSGGA